MDHTVLMTTDAALALFSGSHNLGMHPAHTWMFPQKHVRLDNATMIEDRAFDQMTLDCKQLHSLSLNERGGIMCIGEATLNNIATRCSSIQELTLSGVCSVTDDVMQTFTSNWKRMRRFKLLKGIHIAVLESHLGAHLTLMVRITAMRA